MSRVDAIQELEQQLEATRERILSGEVSPVLLRLLRGLPGSTDNLYLVDHLPEQLEDIFDILVDGRRIVRIEIPRQGISGFPTVDEMTVERYRQGQSTLKRRKLDAAIRLAQKRESAEPF